MNIQRKNSAHHFRMQSEREQTLATGYIAHAGDRTKYSYNSVFSRLEFKTG